MDKEFVESLITAIEMSPESFKLHEGEIVLPCKDTPTRHMLKLTAHRIEIYEEDQHGGHGRSQIFVNKYVSDWKTKLAELEDKVAKMQRRHRMNKARKRLLEIIDPQTIVKNRLSESETD